MAKFPDPSKNYGAEPVNSKIGSGGETIFTAPSQPVDPTPYVPPAPALGGAPAPIISDLPRDMAISSSPFRNIVPIIIGIVAIVLLGLAAFTFLPKLLGGNKSSGNITLTYWGLWEPASVMQTVIADYERDNPGVKINYTMQSPKGYRSRLQTAISSGSGPDIARIHNTWLPMLRKSLSPAPTDLGINISDYYPVVAKNFVVGSSIYALPLEIDGLALYYNPKIIEEVQPEPPTDWNALRKLAYNLTKRNASTGVIERAGMAMGSSNNVDHWSDILALLTMQNSGTPASPSEQSVQDALTFYTLFVTGDKSWDVSQPSSTYAFATGTAAMMLGPAWRVADIKAINPELEFKIAPAPKLPTTDLAWATYWAEAVPISSKNQQAAWEFIKYLSTPEVLQKLYAAETQLRGIGEPYPLKSMASLLANDPLAAPFVNQAGSYTSWYMAGSTYDEGINDQIIKYYEDAVNAVDGGSSINSVIKTLDAGVAQILAKFPEAK